MPNIRVTYAALLALGQIGGPKAEATLVTAAGRPLYLVRHAAARGLGTMRARGQLELLERLAVDDPVLIVRDAAREAVARISGTWCEPQSPLPEMPESLVFVKTANRSVSNLGFRDSYFFDKTPWYHWGENPLSAKSRLASRETGSPQPHQSYRRAVQGRRCRTTAEESSFQCDETSTKMGSTSSRSTSTAPICGS